MLLNTILGALDPDDDGGYFYYSDYQAGARKRYYQRKWPCCAGTLTQSVADYPLNLYFDDERGISVFLYAGSEVRWKARGVPVTLKQETEYPESEQIEFGVEPASPVEFDIRLRIPAWVERGARITVNGKAAAGDAAPGKFAVLRRRWRKGDRIGLTLLFSFRAVAVDDRHPDTVAVMYGPLMLCAVDPAGPLEAALEALSRMRPVAGKRLEFDCETASGTVRMRPFYQVQRELYGTYFQRVRKA